MAVIVIAFLILSLTIFKKITKKVGVKILIGLLVLILSYGYGMAFIDVANTSFTNNPQQIECVIVDKKITGTGRRQVTQYKLFVVLNGEKIDINVDNETYKEKEINDTLLINLCDGNFNIPYYETAE